jgi:DNA polymerase-4
MPSSRRLRYSTIRRLRGKPVAVGGPASRGVVASASYEARRFGVRSAMPTVIARRRARTSSCCPVDSIVTRSTHDSFTTSCATSRRTSSRSGLDEVFADLRSLRRLDVRPIEAADALRRRINGELGLECGVGLGRNKLFAKLASKQSKPGWKRESLSPAPGWCG